MHTWPAGQAVPSLAPAQSPLASDAHAPSADACLQALNSGDLDFAVRCFRTYLNRQPDDAAAHNDLGVALQRQGKAPEALACYERAARIGASVDVQSAPGEGTRVTLALADAQRLAA